MHTAVIPSTYRALFYGSITLSLFGLASCRATQMTATSKDPSYTPTTMRRVLVMAVVRRHANRQLLEDRFVQELKKRGAEGIASHTLVREGEQLDLAAWKRLVSDNHADAVIVSRLIDFDVVEKDVDAKLLNASGSAAGYSYYSSGVGIVYQPGFTLRKETAGVETRVFNAADEKMMWSARTKTNIEQGRDPEAQIRDFVRLMMSRIYKS
jgi:hypothetical protein